MENRFKNDDKQKKISKSKFRLILFATFFFRSFFPLFVVSVILLIVGIFNRVFLYIGLALLGIDVLISVYFTIRSSRLKGSHEMFNKIVEAANGDDPYGELNEITVKWERDDYYRENANEIRGEANTCKTVSEVFDLYKKNISNLAFADETFTVYIKKEKYFFDEQDHYVISFGRSREINDDVECHLYMDVLYGPDRFDRKIEKSFECSGTGDHAEFFAQVKGYLEENSLMDLPVEDINVGASL